MAGSGCARARRFSHRRVSAREHWLRSCCASSSCWVSWDSRCQGCSMRDLPRGNYPAARMEEMDYRRTGKSGRAWKGLTRAGEERGMNRHERTQVELWMKVKRVGEGRGGRKREDMKDGAEEGHRECSLEERWLERRWGGQRHHRRREWTLQG